MAGGFRGWKKEKLGFSAMVTRNPERGLLKIKNI